MNRLSWMIAISWNYRNSDYYVVELDIQVENSSVNTTDHLVQIMSQFVSYKTPKFNLLMLKGNKRSSSSN